ncbi:UDP-N-acetylglucosamine--N-acetylmuramyl-(pentapeptide) pyrophosphoryl-undecaprenol N-acetylglucosamine transferase [Candidatus Microgenomates bacterium]|nr:UDP-N-acetylglucosamine--N-acetylmuramyl-(pentapeptide) pyrophosphoryl-undecaprenol N-acetylglucosamine transferase [Candidatus Microgenomates bacterium]
MREKKFDNKKTLRVVLTGGGTLGHVLPALAVLDSLKILVNKKKDNLEIAYIGRRQGMEKKLVEERGLKYLGILSGKFRRYFDLRNLTDIFLVIGGFLQSVYLLKKNHIDIVFAKGGFVTVPVVWAAFLWRIPVVAHESDTILGLANRIIFPFVKKIAVGFPVELYPVRYREKMVFTGNPIRPEILRADLSKKELYKKYDIFLDRPLVLIIGGSQGSVKINEWTGENLKKFLGKYVVAHATGESSFGRMNEIKNNLDRHLRKNYLIFDYIEEDLGSFLKNSDLIISRAGANALSEIIHLGKTAFIIPFPFASTNHQYTNAKFLADQKAIVMKEEKDLDKDSFFEEIEKILKDKKLQNKLAKNSINIFPSDSADIIAQTIFALAKGKK